MCGDVVCSRWKMCRCSDHPRRSVAGLSARSRCRIAPTAGPTPRRGRREARRIPAHAAIASRASSPHSAIARSRAVKSATTFSIATGSPARQVDVETLRDQPRLLGSSRRQRQRLAFGANRPRPRGLRDFQPRLAGADLQPDAVFAGRAVSTRLEVFALQAGIALDAGVDDVPSMALRKLDAARPVLGGERRLGRCQMRLVHADEAPRWTTLSRGPRRRESAGVRRSTPLRRSSCCA